MNGKEAYCPLIRGECARERCAWFYRVVILDPEGIDQQDHCAASLIAKKLCELAESSRGAK